MKQQTQVNISANVEIIIPFHDIDAMNIVWHGHYYKYFEIARTKLLKLISMGPQEMYDYGYQWPVIESSCRYIQAIRYDQNISVTATIIEYEHRLKISYLIQNEQQSIRLAKGSTTKVAVDLKSKELLLNSPDILCNNIRNYSGHPSFSPFLR